MGTEHKHRAIGMVTAVLLGAGALLVGWPEAAEGLRTGGAAPDRASIPAAVSETVTAALPDPAATNSVVTQVPLGSEPGGSGLPGLPGLIGGGGGGDDAPAPESDPGPAGVPSGYNVTWRPGVTVGQYRSVIDVRANELTRIDLTVSGEMVGTYAVGPATRTVTALVHIDGPLTSLGVRSSVPVQVNNTRLTKVAPTYTTRGTKILDPSGAPWQFRGVNRQGYEEAPDGTPSLNQFDHESVPMWRWGFNAVRLPLNQEYWLANCDMPASWVHDSPQRADGQRWRYQDVIDEEVRRFTARGILVLLDLHVSSRGVATGCNTESRLHEMPDRRSVYFWHSVATRYRTQPGVAFDLYNEPHLADAKEPPSYEDAKRIWREGGPIAYTERTGMVPRNATYDAVGMQELYNTVRATGATNLVFVGGLYYAHRPEVILDHPLDTTGFVASVHMYCREGCSAAPPPEQTQYIDGRRPNGSEGLGVADRYPTVMTEFGAEQWWDGTNNRAYLKYFEANGLGWASWTWAGGGDTVGRSPYGILRETTQASSARTPNASGTPVWDGLAAIRQSRGY